VDSLSPLSCGLFGILGVTKETVLQAARAAQSRGVTSLGHLADCSLQQCARTPSKAGAVFYKMATLYGFVCTNTSVKTVDVGWIVVQSFCLNPAALLTKPQTDADMDT
jgi:hypothetical protein